MIQSIEKITENNKSREYECNYASENENFLEKSLINISTEYDELEKVISKKSNLNSQMSDSQNISNGGNLSLEKTNITDKKLTGKKLNISRNKSIEFKHARKPSQEDSKSIIVYGGTDFSMNNSCIDDFEQFTDLKSQISIDNKIAPNDDIADDASFTRILEVDEEYYESNWTTERANNVNIKGNQMNSHLAINTMVTEKLSNMGLVINKNIELLNNDSTVSTNDRKSMEYSVSSMSLNQNSSKKNQTIKIKGKEGRGKIEIPKLNLKSIKPKNN